MQYEILETKDSSFGDVKRFSAKAIVPITFDRSSLEQAARDIVENYKIFHPHNALMVFFYRRGTSVSGEFTAGRALWAPGGDWLKADQVSVGDYSKHQLVIEYVAQVAPVNDGSRVDGLTISQRKKIFFALTATQDSGVDDTLAYGVVAQRFGIEEVMVHRIAVEGAINRWPMP